jgi:hypothetical protein
MNTGADSRAIETFRQRARRLAGACTADLTFPNHNSHREILLAVYAALSPSGGLHSETAASHSFMDEHLLVTGRGDGLLSQSVQIGNYGPPELRVSYTLVVSAAGAPVGTGDDEADLCVLTCDDNDFDLVVTKATFSVQASTAERVERAAQIIVAWHSARGLHLLARGP